MEKLNRIRPFTILLLVATIALFSAAYWIFGPERLPPDGRRRLPTGPVTPMVSMATKHGLIIAGDGSMWSWGDGLGSGLGLGNINNIPYLRRIGNETNWVSASAGPVHSLALKSDGTIWAWGQNTVGQFGNGTTSTAAPNFGTTPVRGPPGNDWKAVAVGDAFSIGLKTNGTLWVWGLYPAVQIGGKRMPPGNPAMIVPGTNWVRVVAGGMMSAAFKSNGSLWLFNPRLKGFPSPVPISQDTNWVDANFGSGMLLAVKSDGTLWAWGDTASGLSNNPDPSTFALMRIGTNNDWQSIRGSTEANMFLLTKKDGSVWSFDLWSVQLRQSPETGSSTSLDKVRFTRVPIPGPVVAVGTARGGTGVALGWNGEVWTWGEMLGTNAPAKPRLQMVAKWAKKIRLDLHWGDAHPIVREEPWLLPNIDPDAAMGK